MSDNAQLMNQAREIKTMGTYCSKLNLKNPKHAEMLLTQVVEKATFTSSYAQPFVDRIRQLAMGNVEGHSCIICKKNEAINGVFCFSCMAIIMPDEDIKAKRTRASLRPGTAQKDNDSADAQDVNVKTATVQDETVKPYEAIPASKAATDDVQQEVRKIDIITPKVRTIATETSVSADENIEIKEKTDKKLINLKVLIPAACIAALAVILAVKFIPHKTNGIDNIVREEEGAEIDPKELTTVLTKPETDINESIKDVARKEYDNDGEMMPVLEAEDGSLIGLDDNDEAYYVEITEGSDPNAAIAGVRVGDDVHQAADKFKQAGAVEDVQAEQYWAELFFNDGQPNIYLLCFNYAVPDSDKTIAYMATIDRDTVIGVSAEVK